MAFTKKPIKDEEETGQKTDFLSSQGSGMIGAGTGEGGLGVAGGSITGKTPFVNPEDIARANVGAGTRLAERLGQTFMDPARQIGQSIGEEKRAFESAAQKQQLDWDKYHKGLGQQAATTPMSLTGGYDPEKNTFTDDMAQLQKNLALQYSGPQEFAPTKQITDPLDKFKERVATYGVGEPGSGLEEQGKRQALIGEIMSPTSTGGSKSLEEYFLTSSPDALQNLINQIGQIGAAVHPEQEQLGAATTKFGGYQGVEAPIARLDRVRKELEELVKRRQAAAQATREGTRTAIGEGISGIRGDVDASVAQAIEDAKARQALLTGRDAAVSHIQTKGLGLPPMDSTAGDKPPGEVPGGQITESYGPEVDRIADLFRGKYTDEERALAARLGLTDEQVDQAQTYMHQLLDPMGLGGEGAGPSLPSLTGGDEQAAPYSLIEDWRDKGYEAGDFGEYTYEQVDPLNALYTLLNPENIYTSEQMITDPQSQYLGALERLLGGDPSIVRAEDALGADKMSIDTKGDVQSWLDTLGGFTERSRERADESREGRAIAEFEATVGPPPAMTGNYQKDKESLYDYRQRIEKAAKEAADMGSKIDAYDAWETARDKIANDKSMTPDQQKWAMDAIEKNKPDYEPSQLDRFLSMLEGGHAQALKERNDAAAEKVEVAEANRLRAQQVAEQRRRKSYQKGGSNYGGTWAGKESKAARQKSGRQKGQSGR